MNHTDFEKNTFAKKVLFGDKIIDNTLINSACNGLYPAIDYIICRIALYMNKNRNDLNISNYLILLLNFKFLLTICVQFSHSDSLYFKEYLR